MVRVRWDEPGFRTTPGATGFAVRDLLRDGAALREGHCEASARSVFLLLMGVTISTEEPS
jgi:hypothetical protein